MLDKILVDSSFLYTLYNHTERQYQEVVAVAHLYDGQFLIPYVVLTETAYLFHRSGGARALARFLDALLKANYQYEIVSPDDLTRVTEIIRQYPKANLDFVDCCIMALAERLDITQVCTLDQRDFSIFRPRHCDYLEILP